MAKSKSPSTTKKSIKKTKSANGLPVILLLLLITIIVYGLLKLNNVQSPFSQSSPTPMVQKPMEQKTMDETIVVVSESDSTQEAVDEALKSMDASESTLEVPTDDDLSGDFIGL